MVSAGRSGSVERTGVAIVALATMGACGGGAIASVIARAIDAPALMSAAIGAIAGIVVACLLARRLGARMPEELDGWFGRRPVVTVVWCAVAVISVANTARLTLFAGDPTQVWASMAPPIPDSATHQCLAAYVRAGELASHGQADLWIDADYASGRATDVAGMGRYMSDPYEYPPPFVVLPRAVLAVTDDYQSVRVAWFGISALAFWIAFVALAMWIRGRAGATAMLLLPVVAMSFPLMMGLQFGQAHVVVVAAAIGGMVLLARGRSLSGGVLLAFAIVTKIFPGLLLVHLAMRRRWSQLAITIAAIAAFVGISALVLGLPTLESYVSDQLPRMASGEAFAFTEHNFDNHSPYGLAFKLAALGVDGADRQLASILAWSWGAIALIFTILASRGRGDVIRDAVLWLGIVCMATLRSPFAPSYTAIGSLWLLAIGAGVIGPRWWRPIVIGLCWVIVQGVPPLGSPATSALVSFPSQLVTISIALIAVWPHRQPA